MRFPAPPMYLGLALALAAAPAARCDDRPAAKAFELRSVGVGDTYKCVRFRPGTGEAWQLSDGRWEKLEEAAAPPAGDYDVLLIPAGVLLAVRVDRATGATWLVQGGKWTPIKEPPAKGNPAKPAPGYSLRHTRVGDQLHVLRFHTATGAAWHLGGDKFVLLRETGPVPAGDYDVTMVAGQKEWMAFRIDRTSGKTWLLLANQWSAATEPE
ncbi:hypothetical protein [Gemmata sp.]|uniref:hypothetical protein n=1 Tax=Gemmata sp. TaxID=1914242 RepID=UPI003F7294FA